VFAHLEYASANGFNVAQIAQLRLAQTGYQAPTGHASRTPENHASNSIVRLIVNRAIL